MRSRGLTLIEVLVSVGIAAVLSAIAMPVLMRAKESGRQTACASNLRQLHLATAMYRSEWDGDGVFGDAHRMGLPRSFMELAASQKLDWDVFRCPRTLSEIIPQVSMAGFVKFWRWPEHDLHEPRWETNVLKFEDQMIMIVDMNHNDRDRAVRSRYTTKTGFGVRLSGQAVRIHKKAESGPTRLGGTPKHEFSLDSDLTPRRTSMKLARCIVLATILSVPLWAVSFCDWSDFPNAFDPFFTTRRGSGGSGLGLHVIHNLVTQLLGGDIELTTAPGQGAQFLIRIPLRAPEQAH